MTDSAAASPPATGRLAALGRRSWAWAGLVLALVAVDVAAQAQAPAQPATQTPFRPVAVVNDSIITAYDLAQRMQLLTVLGAQAANPQALQGEALDQLVDDRLKLQAGRQIGLKITPELLEAGIEIVAQRAQLKPDEFLAAMGAQGVGRMAVEDYAGAEALWLQVIRARFANRVQPGEAEINAEIDIALKRQNYDFRVLEIGLPMTGDGRTAVETQALAARLSTELNAGGDFAAAVKRHSRAPSAARGGEIGWVNSERLPSDLVRALAELEIGQVSSPLPVPGGLSLLKLADRRLRSLNASADDPELRDRVRSQLINLKSARLAEGLMQELRRDALIEIR